MGRDPRDEPLSCVVPHCVVLSSMAGERCEVDGSSWLLQLQHESDIAVARCMGGFASHETMRRDAVLVCELIPWLRVEHSARNRLVDVPPVPSRSSCLLITTSLQSQAANAFPPTRHDGTRSTGDCAVLIDKCRLTKAHLLDGCNGTEQGASLAYAITLGVDWSGAEGGGRAARVE